MTKKSAQRKRVGIEEDVLKSLKKLCIDNDISLNGLFKRVVAYQNLTGRLLSLPEEANDEILLDISMMDTLLPLWMNNVGENFGLIKEGKDVRGVPDMKNTPALVIGAGPTLYRNKHLELLAEKGFDGHIFATDAVLKDCLELGIIPDYVMFMDANEKIYPFIDHAIVDKYADKLTAIMNVFTHPKVANRWKGDIMWFQVFIEEMIAPNVTFTLQQLTHTTALMSAGHSASIGWSMAAIKNYNPIVSIGLDLSFPPDMPIEESRIFEYYLKANKGNREKTSEMLEACYKHYHHKFFNTDCYFESIFGAYTDSSKRVLQTLNSTGIRIINCTEGGTLEGEGIECMWFNEYLEGGI